MGPILKGLKKLQSVENRLRAAKLRLARCRRSVIFQENQLRSLTSELEAKQEEIKLTRIQVDRLELELKTTDEKIAKYRAALNLAKSNKEYASILTELNTTKADSTKIENQMLELMKNIEADEAACQQIQMAIESQREKLNAVRKEAEKDAAKYEAQIEEIQKEWDAAAAEVAPDVLEIFKRVAETYDGQAIAEVNRLDDKSDTFSCGGCFMRLPAEVANQLMTKDEIIRCTNCTRILVLNEEDF